MKRMYVVLTILFLLILGAFTTCFAQFSTSPTPEQAQADREFNRLKRRMELREEMHRRMREKLLRGMGPDQDLFKDMEQMFEDTMNDSFSSFDSLTETASSNFTSEWQESKTGRTLIITPKDPQQKLDIDVKSGLVTIKGTVETKNQNGSFISNFSNSFSVPGDCDADKVKMDQKEGKILMEFPYKEAKQINVPKKEERRPLPPQDGAVEV